MGNSHVEVVHFSFLDTFRYRAAHRFILDGRLTGRRLRRPELSKAMRRKVRASEILFGKKKWVGNTVGGSGIRRVFPPGMYKTEFF